MDKRGSQASNRVYFRLFILSRVAVAVIALSRSREDAAMNKQIALAITLTHALGCSPIPRWNLDTGVIPFSAPLVAHHLIDGLQRLGARQPFLPLTCCFL